MTPREAWEFVKKKIEKVEPETITEIDEYYVFSIRPLGANPGFSTGSSVVLVNKESGELESASVGDSRLFQGEALRVIDPTTI